MFAAATSAAAKSAQICKPYPISAKVQDLGAKKSLTLVVIGDTGNEAAPIADQPQKKLRLKELAKAITDSGVKPDAMLLVGDNIYECGVTSANDPKFRIYAPLMSLGVPMFVVLGNHDYGEDGCTKQQEKTVDPQAEVDHHDPTGNWRLIDRNYVLRWPGLADIAMFDTTPVKNGCANQKAIIDNLTGALAAMPKGEWRIAAGHHGLFSSGEHGQDCKDAGLMRKLLDKKLQDGRVDLYISGHDHDLEISNLGRRPMFLVSGAGSRRRTNAAAGNPSLIMNFGFAVVEITSDKLTARLFDVEKKAFTVTSTLTQPGASTASTGTGSAPVPKCP